ncbi:MAG: 5-(carboxyamino)imidazole ribonucleotide synthase [Bacteroidetes bacterium]|nr:5-(carboxyamino)imidazole ribonucleotide synthase [Bacteroidota bacterium]MBK9524783.1 5-(carboxyamino)imidazole ribonucleotide synthase [Bacteroidota bacterium]MBK9542949.1 5-(carboxyamino)imidazole ribonucleotide synthase [Bacteroidota bacterium]
MSKAFYDTLRFGILGGGQLGRMLLQKAADFNVTNCVLDPDPEAPCRFIADEFVCGSFRDFDTVINFGRNLDLLTIEIEHVNVDALEQLEKEGVKVYPQSKVIRLVQDKGLQKIFYRTHGIPTAEFHLLDSIAHIEKYASQFPFMQKLRKGGYDGKGVVRLESSNEINKGFDEPSILEKLVDFEKELSVLVARNSQGECFAFPVVEMEFNAEANLVEYLFSPALISADQEKKAIQIATHVAQSIQVVGLLAVEMFLTRSGEILVNEIAPRPHNSGHQTIEGNVTSQYEQHLRAILGLPLGSTQITKPSVMVNLLGEKGYTGHALYEGLQEALAIDGVHLHLYGKKITKPFRKMGHVTVTADTLEEAKLKAIRVNKMIRVIAS